MLPPWPNSVRATVGALIGIVLTLSSGEVSAQVVDMSRPWIAYSPTHYVPGITNPTTAQIDADLALLASVAFGGVMTYGAAQPLDRIAERAQTQGLATILGVWDPKSASELANAIAAADHVAGYIVGTEGLLRGDYSLSELETAIVQLRSATGKPVTTSEPWFMYLDNAALRDVGDWLAPTVHPFWDWALEGLCAGTLDPLWAARWTADRYHDVVAVAGTKQVVLREAGLPSAPASELSQAKQTTYFRTLLETDDVQFTFFEAFDQTWKSELSCAGDVGKNFGLLGSDRSPKAVITALAVCGDVNVNFSVDPADAALLRAHLADPVSLPLSSLATARCTVIPPLRPCDVLDAMVLLRALLAPLRPPGLALACLAAL